MEVTMYPELKEKIVVISGAGGGLGAAVVRRFHREGARLVLIDAIETGLQRLKQELNLTEANARLGIVDLLDKSAVDSYISETTTGFGLPNICVNLAGGFKMGGPEHENED